ncbi:hypothetical protein PPACK8108_LOCUS22755 [Phakopsora pachyrhizi]|uniref:CNNM transmembrane domain-containing protein n=1 Tax=Phakopsora pachyrhizi TaxID=170000 RepID=A0AAV0BME8_PHAPC|nr:hypothetical protein PPACK8108_LOCUS22755 [Phakopsora pachyrhizi]
MKVLNVIFIWSLVVISLTTSLVIEDNKSNQNVKTIDGSTEDSCVGSLCHNQSAITSSQGVPQVLSASYPIGGNIQRSIGSNSSISDHHKGNRHTLIYDVQAVMIPVLVILSGIFAGLTLGYMSLDSTQLIVLSKSGTEEQKALAKKIAPLRKDGHLLLITLLMANMIANEALPVVSENVMGGGIQAIIVSTVLVIIFSEIIPQSICATHGLKIGATCATPVRVLIFIFYPIAWPIATLLTKLLGKHSGVIYRRAELKELVNLHSKKEEHGGDLAGDVVTIVRGALDLQERVVADSMKPLESCFMLDIETKLDFKALNLILESGHSRIPVYETIFTEFGSKKRILGALLTKQLILIDPEDGLPLRDFPLNPLPLVPSNMPLLNILNCFQEGRSHLAIVFARPETSPLISAVRESAHHSNEPQIYLSEKRSIKLSENKYSDETSKSSKSWKRWLRRKKKYLNGNDHGAQHKPAETPTVGEDEESALGHVRDQEEEVFVEVLPASPLTKPIPTKFKEVLKEKEPIGIISLEDVLEQLLGEPIYDETDQDGSGHKAVQPFLPPEAIEALSFIQNGTRHQIGSDEKKKFIERTMTKIPISPNISTVQLIESLKKPHDVNFLNEKKEKDENRVVDLKNEDKKSEKIEEDEKEDRDSFFEEGRT